ncbi:autophagy protein 5-like [Varroa jacobsoni]|uniref:Autophagy protein 5 n=1 Tax=Varroa destructor TaxID=109461 RepID=A0A7M7K3S1_VARDE|nr:autophagy protein 5-like [Varroa destructor]XP_022690449.1 autophagy protein 5-like [Varroa jacobsoni]
MLHCEDRNTVSKVWSGQIPVCFRLAAQDCSSIEAPDPFFIMLPRISYLPFIWEKVQRYFSPFVAEEHRSSQLWLETPINTTSVLSGSVMLRWHLPIGLLYDLHGGGKLPWTIIIHFRDFPDKELIACETKQVAEAQFMNSVKEADFLKTRKKIMTAMTQSERRQMTAALYALQAESFWAVNRKLMFTSETWKHIPLRIFLLQSSPGTEVSTTAPPVVYQIQKLVPMSGSSDGLPDNSKQPITLRHVLRLWFTRPQNQGKPTVTPELHDLSKKEDCNQCLAAEDGTQTPDTESSPGTTERRVIAGGDGTETVKNDSRSTHKGKPQESTENNGKLPASSYEWGEDMEVILHGIPVPLDAPLQWLAINMSYADNFLYVVVRQRKKTAIV